MRGKILLIVGVGVGYVLGARQGREGLERLKDRAGKLWGTSGVQKGFSKATDFARENVPVVGKTVADAAENLGDKATQASKSSSESDSDSNDSNDSSSSGTDSSSGDDSGESSDSNSDSGPKPSAPQSNG